MAMHREGGEWKEILDSQHDELFKGKTDLKDVTIDVEQALTEDLWCENLICNELLHANGHRIYVRNQLTRNKLPYSLCGCNYNCTFRR